MEDPAILAKLIGPVSIVVLMGLRIVGNPVLLSRNRPQTASVETHSRLSFEAGR
jgi:hypothetical protein